MKLSFKRKITGKIYYRSKPVREDTKTSKKSMEKQGEE